MVEHTVDDDAHAAGMAGLDELDEEPVAGVQVFTARGADRVAGRAGIVILPVLDEGAAVLHDLADMRIDVVVVLRVVLVVRRGHEKRIEVDDADAEALDIVELRAHAGEITTVKPVHVKRLDRGVPVRYTTRCSAEVDVLVVDDVIRRVAITEAMKIWYMMAPFAQSGIWKPGIRRYESSRFMSSQTPRRLKCSRSGPFWMKKL